MRAAVLAKGLIAATIFAFSGGFDSGGTVQAQQWQGTVETDGTVLNIHNPAFPCHEPETIQLTEIWRLDGESDETAFGVIYAAVADAQGIVYLLDTQLKEIVCVDLNGEIRSCIGREGEGPRECRRPVGVLIDAQGRVGVVQNPPAKIALLTPAGESAGDRFLPDYGNGGRLILRSAKATADRLFVVLTTRHHTEQRDTEYLDTLASLGPDNAEYVLYLEQQSSRKFDDSRYTEKERSQGMPWEWTVGPGGRVYISPSYDAYEVLVHDVGGELISVIDRQYVPRPRAKSHVAQLQQYYDKRYENRTRWGFPMTFEVSQTDQDIEKLFARLDGTLWVLPSRGAYDKPDGAVGIFDVFDDEGHFTRQVTLLGDGDLFTDYLLFTRDLLIVVRNVRLDLNPDETGDGASERPYEVICYGLP